MHPFTSVLVPFLIHQATAVTMTAYVAGTGVEAEFAPFVEEYYLVNEDKLSNATFLDLWTDDATMIIQSGTVQVEGPTAILALRNRLLPATGTPSKDWWHVIQGAEVVEVDAEWKTYEVTMIVQSNYVPGNCSQAQ